MGESTAEGDVTLTACHNAVVTSLGIKLRFRLSRLTLYLDCDAWCAGGCCRAIGEEVSYSAVASNPVVARSYSGTDVVAA